MLQATVQSIRAPAETIGSIRRALAADPVETTAPLGRYGLSASRWIHDTHRSVAGPVAHHVLTFQLAGSSAIGRRLGRRWDYGAGPGTATFMPANTEAEFEIDGQVDVLQFYLCPTLLDDCARATRRRSRALMLQAPFAVVDPVIAGVAQMAASGPDSAFSTSPLLRDLAAQVLATHLVEAYSDDPGPPAGSAGRLAGRQLDAVRAHVDARLGDTITLAELAAAVGLSPFHFCRAFKAATGASPYRFVQERRIARAKWLLESTDLPIVEIALDCGFSSQSHLTQTFRKQTQTTPKRWRDCR